jgi:hypothetical protein
VIALVQFLDGAEFLEACTTLAGPPPATNGRDHTAAEPRRICTAIYDYHDESGAVLFKVGRFKTALSFSKMANKKRAFAKSGRIPTNRADGLTTSTAFAPYPIDCLSSSKQSPTAILL